MTVRVTLSLTSLALLAGCGGDEPVEVSTTASESPAQVSAPAATPAPAEAPSINTSEVLVASSVEDMIALLEGEDWWGEPKTDEPLAVPHLLITAIKPNWQEASKNIPVQQKKALFYRLMSHPAYEDFGDLRAQMRARGEPLSSLVLADGMRLD